MNASVIPEHLKRLYRDIRTYEAAQFVSQLAGNAHRILIVGDEWGRDYYTLANRGRQVFNIDIAWQPQLPALAIADAARGIPFATGAFDAVVIAEVLEHLVGDEAALRETRRVLRDDGTLVVTVPFFNDEPEYHVRLHSARTIRRLLQHCGFAVNEFIYRGGWISLPRTVGFLARLFGRQRILDICTRMDRRVGARDHWLLRRTRFYGGYVSARKGQATDFAALNASEFSLEATISRMRSE